MVRPSPSHPPAPRPLRAVTATGPGYDSALHGFIVRDLISSEDCEFATSPTGTASLCAPRLRPPVELRSRPSFTASLATFAPPRRASPCEPHQRRATKAPRHRTANHDGLAKSNGNSMLQFGFYEGIEDAGMYWPPSP